MADKYEAEITSKEKILKDLYRQLEKLDGQREESKKIDVDIYNKT